MMIEKCRKFDGPKPSTTENADEPETKPKTDADILTSVGLGGILSGLTKPAGGYTPAQISLIQTLLRRGGKGSTASVGGPATASGGADWSIGCDLCGALVSGGDVGALIGHLKCHLNFAGYSCAECGQGCPSFAALQSHMASAHQSSVPTADRRLLADALLRLAEHSYGRGSATVPNARCSLCSLNVPLQKTAIDAHLAEHQPDGPFKCAMCTQRFIDVNGVKEHIAARHKGSFVLFTYAPVVHASNSKDSSLVEKAFPFLKPEVLETNLNGIKTMNGGGKEMAIDCRPVDIAPSVYNKATIECLLCSAQISRNMSCLIAHAKVHLAYKPLKCEYCAFRHFAMSKIKRHNVRVHPGKAVKVSYHPISDIGRQVKETKLLCFGAHASSTVWASADAAAAAREDDDDPDDVELSSPTGGGMGKKACQVCNTHLANNPSSFENHACKHLDYKPFHCHYCAYQSYIRGKVTRHIQQVHNGFQIKINHKPQPGMKEKVQAVSGD